MSIAMETYGMLDEQELLERLRNDDETAFSILYLRYNALLYVQAYKRLQNREEAKDIIHDIFSSLWENRKKIDIREDLQAYLYQAVRNRVINRSLKSRRASEHLESFAHFAERYAAGTDHLARERLMVSLIEKEIASLPERMREVFELSRKHELSHKEIAAALGITEQSVRSHIKGALRILRLRLGTVILYSFFSAL